MTEHTPHTRRQFAVEMSQKIVADIMELLRRDIPKQLEHHWQFTYQIDIKIRDGIPQLWDCNISDDELSECRLPEGQDLARTIRALEQWLVKFLPTRLLHGHHGWVEAELGVEPAGMMRPRIGDTPAAKPFLRRRYNVRKQYDWKFLQRGR